MKNNEIKKENESAYMTLYKKLRNEIVDGIYPLQSKLPSKRTLADQFGVSVVTVEHAYALLCDEGYIESRERSGYFSVFNPSETFSAIAYDESHENVINAAADFVELQKQNKESPFPFSVLTKTMRRVISEYGEQIFSNSPNFGCIELREAIRKYLSVNRGIHTEIKQIIIGSGSEYLYNLVIMLLGKDKIFAIESPSYKKIEQVYSVLNVNIEKLPIGKDGIDGNALSTSRAAVLHVSPYRSFPSGVTASASKRFQYIKWANEKDRFIIEDDFESEFSILRKPEDTLYSNSQKDNVIYMNTFSKTISPSLRVGYMVLPKILVERFNKLFGFYSCTVPTYIQLVLSELMKQGDFERHINRTRRKKRREN